MRIGPQMSYAVSIVRANPGCCKKFVAERISPLRYTQIPVSKDWALGYEPINRAIKAGLIKAALNANGSYSLTVVE
jgi:hypothetical protein